MIQVAELVGYFAALLVFLTFYMKTIVRRQSFRDGRHRDLVESLAHAV